MIQKLPPDLINKIAAGEVVERPVSIVKELTENALDAGASTVEVNLEKGGTKLIQVIDNGSGMSKADAELCLVQHATSKISSTEDLFQITTLGFRGEALASIASVSQFSLVTKQLDAVEGYKVWLDENHQPQIEVVAANTGTVVTVEHLFHQVPARRKFLKTDSTEMTHILRYLQQLALIRPDVELKAKHNGKELFHYLPSEWEGRVEQVLGQNFYQNLIPISGEGDGLKVTGFIARPTFVHATHKNQYLFVNGRAVYDSLVNRSVLEAYDTMVPRGYFPAFVLKVDIDPERVDVNVHPRKSEVRFLDPGAVIRVLKASAARALQEADLTDEKDFSTLVQKSEAPMPSSTSSSFASIPSASAGGSPQYRTGSGKGSVMQFREKRPSQSQVSQAMNFNQSFSGGIETVRKSALEERQWSIVGQIHLSFILVESPEGLMVFDQHAVSEIVNYHRLMTQRQNGEICSQQLLIPDQVELTLEEKVLLDAHIELLRELGWECDELTNTSYQVSALPELLKIENIQETIQGLLSELKEAKSPEMNQRERVVLMYEACRSAVMFGDQMTFEEMKALLNAWIETPNNASCEHGRPASAKISVDEMKKFFKR